MPEDEQPKVSEDCTSENAEQQRVKNLALTNWCLNKLCFAHQEDRVPHDRLVDLTDVVFIG